MTIIYTYKERTEKKYTVQDAINSAAKLIKGHICLDSVCHMMYDRAITVVELNELVDKIIDDSFYWSGGYHVH